MVSTLSFPDGISVRYGTREIIFIRPDTAMEEIVQVLTEKLIDTAYDDGYEDGHMDGVTEACDVE